jgi:hypothetical protein
MVVSSHAKIATRFRPCLLITTTLCSYTNVRRMVYESIMGVHSSTTSVAHLAHSGPTIPLSVKYLTNTLLTLLAYRRHNLMTFLVLPP